MTYAKIVNNVVEQTQPYYEAGFVQVPNSVIAGMVKNVDGTFSAKTIVKTAEEIADEAKAIGLDYGGYMVPLTSADAVGMLQVKAAFEFGIPSTNIVFSNGVIVPMSAADFPAFAVWFATERNRFFV